MPLLLLVVVVVVLLLLLRALQLDPVLTATSHCHLFAAGRCSQGS